jgi:hypothetical protein
VGLGSGSANYSTSMGTMSLQTSAQDFSSSFGYKSGSQNAGLKSTCAGAFSGALNVGDLSTGVGFEATKNNSGIGAVGVGAYSSKNNAGDYSVSLGYKAGETNQSANSIVINASGSTFNGSAGAGRFHVNPIRNDGTTQGLQLLMYNPATKEITYN